MSTLLKPKDKEGRITLSAAKRRKKRDELFHAQQGICAVCQKGMTLVPGFLNSATLGHRIVQPAGCKKRDNDDNISSECWSCNAKLGSREH